MPPDVLSARALNRATLARQLLLEPFGLVVMRGTIHLVTAADCVRLRPLMQPILDGELARHPEAKTLRDVAGFRNGPSLR